MQNVLNKLPIEQNKHRNTNCTQDIYRLYKPIWNTLPQPWLPLYHTLTYWLWKSSKIILTDSDNVIFTSKTSWMVLTKSLVTIVFSTAGQKVMQRWTMELFILTQKLHIFTQIDILEARTGLRRSLQDRGHFWSW